MIRFFLFFLVIATKVIKKFKAFLLLFASLLFLLTCILILVLIMTSLNTKTVRAEQICYVLSSNGVFSRIIPLDYLDEAGAGEDILECCLKQACL